MGYFITTYNNMLFYPLFIDLTGYLGGDIEQVNSLFKPFWYLYTRCYKKYLYKLDSLP